LMSEAIAGTAERFDVFAKIPHENLSIPRWLRPPSLALAVLWCRLRDAL